MHDYMQRSRGKWKRCVPIAKKASGMITEDTKRELDCSKELGLYRERCCMLRS